MSLRVTVIMAVYNAASTLAEALDSLYNQTYKNFRIVLCDDASTDSSFKIAESYAIKYGNITLLKNEENIKLAASLNKCLKCVDTEFVARMDADDISEPGRFEKQVAFLDENKSYSIVSSSMIHFDEDGDWGITKVVEKPDRYFFKYGPPHPHAPSMIRTSVINEVNGYTVNRLLVRGQDYYLWYKIYKAGYKGFNILEPLYRMRDDKAALSRRTFTDRCKNSIVRFKVLKDLAIPFYYIYALTPLIKALVPKFIIKRIRRSKLK